MVNIGILGPVSSGKTSIFLLFIKYLEENGERVLQGVPGGAEKLQTETVDFIRFTYKGFLHVLYGTGGHNALITDYYRRFVLRNADRFVCIIDLSEPVEEQLKFFSFVGLSNQQFTSIKPITLCFNKYDLHGENFAEYKNQVTTYLTEKLHQQIMTPVFPTVAIVYDNEFEEYNRNCFQALISQCTTTNQDPFAIWNK